MLSAEGSPPTLIGGFIIGAIVVEELNVGSFLEGIVAPIKGMVLSTAIKGHAELGGVVVPVFVSKGTEVLLSIVSSLEGLVKGVVSGRVVVLRGQAHVFPSRISNPPKDKVSGTVLGRTIRKVDDYGILDRYCRATSLVPITLDQVS